MKRDDSASQDYQANVHAKKKEDKKPTAIGGRPAQQRASERERASACICTLEHAQKHASGTITSASASSKRSHRNPFDLVRFGTAAGRGCGIDDGYSCDSYAILIRFRHVITYTLCDCILAYATCQKNQSQRYVDGNNVLGWDIAEYVCTVLSFGITKQSRPGPRRLQDIRVWSSWVALPKTN